MNLFFLNRSEETEIDYFKRLGVNQMYKTKTRESESDFEYQRRLDVQEAYRQKDKKSETKWESKLAYNAQFQKKKRSSENFQSRRKRLRAMIDYQIGRQNWAR